MWQEFYLHNKCSVIIKHFLLTKPQNKSLSETDANECLVDGHKVMTRDGLQRKQ